MKKRCEAINKKNNRPCRVTNLVDEKFCRYHSPLPEYVELRTVNAIAGGKANKSLKLSMKGFRVRGAGDIATLFAKVLEEIAHGRSELDATTKKYIASYGKMYLEASSQANTEKQIKELSEAVARMQQK